MKQRDPNKRYNNDFEIWQDEWADEIAEYDLNAEELRSAYNTYKEDPMQWTPEMMEDEKRVRT